MTTETFEKVNELGYDVLVFDEIEQILWDNMIYNQDKMILDIMEYFKNVT